MSFLGALTVQGGGAVQSAARGALPLWGDYSLADPHFLWLFPIALVFFAWGRSKRGRARGRVSIVPASTLRSLRQRLMWIPGTLQVLALLCVVVALARPLRGNVYEDVVSEGVDIALVVDRSSSMEYFDLDEKEQRTRLDVVKEVVGEFAKRRMGDREGAADNCALISFARYPSLLCPFTLDYDALEGMLEKIELARIQAEDGTGIGAALAKAVAVLRPSEAKSKVVVLLTDGENNIYDILPDQAAELAAEEEIRVYTVYSARYLYTHSPFRGMVKSTTGFDTTELQRIAEVTGGRFYHARDRESLEDIYAEIEALERTERTERRYEETYDLYLWSLLPAILLYGLGWLSTGTWARRLA